MKREIKFRYYDKIVKSFVYSDEFGFENELEKLQAFFAKAKHYAEGTVQQYTESKDENGNEIYEGDILYSELGGGIEGTVVFVDGTISVERSEGEYYYLINICERKASIIGNIFNAPLKLKNK